MLLLEDVLSADECEEFVESMRTQDGNWTEGFWIHVPAPVTSQWKSHEITLFQTGNAEIDLQVALLLS